MSTDYYMVCDKCKVAIDVASWGLTGFSFYSGEPECMKALRAFLERHTLCGGALPRLWDEHHVDDAEYEAVEWRTISSGVPTKCSHPRPVEYAGWCSDIHWCPTSGAIKDGPSSWQLPYPSDQTISPQPSPPR